MRIGALDPPYIGQSQRHYGDHPDFAGEVDHIELLRSTKEFDGWFLHCSAPTLPLITRWADEVGVAPYRIMAWVKPFAAFKRNVPVAYAWEPVLVSPARKPTVSGRTVMRDWCAESITMQRGLSGAKPEAVSRWLFEVVGAEPDDELVDAFPGTGAITAAWERWRADILSPGSAPSPAEDRRSRMPKWAQMEMEAMRAEVDYLERQGAPEHGGHALTGDERWTVDKGTGRSDATLTWANRSGHISIDWSSEDPRWWSEIYNDDRSALAALVADVRAAARLRSLAAIYEQPSNLDTTFTFTGRELAAMLKEEG